MSADRPTVATGLPLQDGTRDRAGTKGLLRDGNRILLLIFQSADQLGDRQPRGVAHFAPAAKVARVRASLLVSSTSAGYLIPGAPAGAPQQKERSERMAPAIRVEGLIKRYGGVVAIDGLGFEVEAGSTTALLGANGAGKTTTIAIILGLLAASAGRVTVLGEEIPRHRARVLGRMNFSSPYVDLPLRLSVRQNLLVYTDLYRVPAPKARIAELAADLDLEPLLDRPTGRLSAGQKTRLLLAKALINEPELLLLDEPTASLDPDTADVIRGYLERYQEERGATVLLASHNMAEVERLCSDVLMLKQGRLVDRGAPADLLSRYGRATLEQVFLDIARRPGDLAPARAAE
jgi:ABC-2 type transport system ATP-binding protein